MVAAPLSARLFAGLLLLVAGTVLAADRPNVLVFVADDASWDDFGAYGHPTIRTPNIDALAQRGWAADNAFLTSPQCSPSRISMLTGLYPHQTSAEDLHVAMPPEFRTIAAYLREAGYFTGSMRKQHLGPHGAAQFDWYDKGLDELPQFLDRAQNRPFFLWVGFRDPHRPYGDAPALHEPDEVRLPPTVLDTPETRADYVRYYDEIARMDAAIGAFLDILDDRALRDSTYVVFLSDNGAPMPRAKGTLYDAGIKTPFIVTGPGILPGARFRPLVSVIDLAPTVLDWAGVPAPAVFQGRSITRQIADPSLPGRDAAFSERNWHNADEHMRSIRTDRYKLIWNNYIHLPHGTPSDIAASPSWQALRHARDSGELTPAQSRLFETPRPRVELYDLEQDPHELVNLAADPENRDRIQALMARLERWMAETDDFPPHRRRRDDNIDRVTGTKFTRTLPPLIDD